MFASRDFKIAGRYSRLIFAVTAMASFFAVVAATPSASIGKETLRPGLKIMSAEPSRGVEFRPLGKGPSLQVGRAYGADDEDCTAVVTKVPLPDGRVRVKHAMTCAD